MERAREGRGIRRVGMGERGAEGKGEEVREE